MQGAAKITYDYKDNKQIKHFFNKDNEPIESAGVFALEYSLDPNGNRAGLMCLGKDGSMIENRNKIHSWTWSVLPDGMVRELRYNLKGEETVMNPFCPFYELRFTYNDKGYTTRMANFKADTLYNCTAENCGDIGVSYFTFTPNQYGDLENQSVFNVTGQMSNLYWGWSKRVNKYDENGYLLETRVFDQDNEYVGGKLIPVIQNTYDSHGAIIEVKNLDKNGNLINSPDNGVAVTDYKYDEVGNRTETLSFDKDKVAVNLTAQK
jgi:YD repeat-containing protein